jgi:hypothetical protein
MNVKETTTNDIVTTDKFAWSDLWKKEDWQAVWIGFIIIAIGAISVLTGAFDFSAAKFSTWGNGTSLSEQLNAGFFGKLLLTAMYLEESVSRNTSQHFLDFSYSELLYV